MNNADLIVATLKAAGVDHGFGIPSGNVLPLIDAMRSGRPAVRADRARGVGGLRGRRHGAHDRRARALHRDARPRRHEPRRPAWATPSSTARRCSPSPATCPPRSSGGASRWRSTTTRCSRPITKASLPLRERQGRLGADEALEIALSEPRGARPPRSARGRGARASAPRTCRPIPRASTPLATAADGAIAQAGR